MLGGLCPLRPHPFALKTFLTNLFACTDVAHLFEVAGATSIQRLDGAETKRAAIHPSGKQQPPWKCSWQTCLIVCANTSSERGSTSSTVTLTDGRHISPNDLGTKIYCNCCGYTPESEFTYISRIHTDTHSENSFLLIGKNQYETNLHFVISFISPRGFNQSHLKLFNVKHFFPSIRKKNHT